jgi:hypothetical protein
MLPISQKADYRDEAAKFLPYSLRAMQGTLAKTGGIALRLNVRDHRHRTAGGRGA